MAAWMMYSLAVGTLTGLAALAGHHCCRSINVPVRWIWFGGMAATVMLAAAGLVHAYGVDAAPAPLVAHVSGEAVASSGEKVPPLAAAVAGVRRTLDRTVGAVYAAADRFGGSGRVLGALWLMASASLLLLLGGTMARVNRSRAGWRLHRISDVSVLVSPRTGPAVIGLARPSIVVPAWLLSEPAERQRLVVQHEDEHRSARDHVMLAAACAMVCVLPWNAALWWMLLRLRLAVELDCDARVLRSGAGARSYGSLLLEIAARTRAFPFGAPALADSRTHLERRLIAMTENHTPRRVRAAAAGLAALLLLTTACATDLPTAAAIDEMDVRQARVQAEQAGLLIPSRSDRAPLFMVDGVIVSEQVAKDMLPEEISSIEVVKAPAALRAYGERAAHGVVRIASRAAESGTASFEEVKAPLGTPLARGGNEIRKRRSDVSLMRLRASRIESDDAYESASDPLIVLDGVVVTGSFSMSSLAPESIESVEVLKGGAATRLYGQARAANGVIRITTRAGGK